MEVSSTELGAWIDWLGDHHFDRRQSAQYLLRNAGEQAVPFLAKATASEDPERSIRAAYLLHQMAHDPELGVSERASAALADLALSPSPHVKLAIERTRRDWQTYVAKLLRDRGLQVTWDSENANLITVKSVAPQVGNEDLALLSKLRITELDLRNSQVSDEGLQHLANQSQLVRLNLQRTRITNEGLQQLCPRLKQLASISVEHTAVDDQGLASIAECRQLTTLYLGGSQVRGPGLRHFAQHPLTYLSFQHSNIVDDSVSQYIGALSQLETLGLDDTSVSDACLSSLAALKNLKVLWLNRCDITNDAVPLLLQINSLAALHLADTRISEEALQELRQQKPEWQITSD
jgi:hypothetical protein